MEEVSAKLAELESTGMDIIPLEEREELAVGPAAGEVHEAAKSAQKSGRSSVINTEEHREALREAILDARRELIIISPWLRTAAVDWELIRWLRTALDRRRALQVAIGYGIGGDDARRHDWTARDQQSALRRLHQVGSRSRGRLRVVEIGNTHEKVVVCDDRYAIISSFNWLSFNPRPGKGIRRETGVRVDDRNEVARIKTELRRVLAGG